MLYLLAGVPESEQVTTDLPRRLLLTWPPTVLRANRQPH